MTNIDPKVAALIEAAKAVLDSDTAPEGGLLSVAWRKVRTLREAVEAVEAAVEPKVERGWICDPTARDEWLRWSRYWQQPGAANLPYSLRAGRYGAVRAHLYRGGVLVGEETAEPSSKSWSDEQRVEWTLAWANEQIGVKS